MKPIIKNESHLHITEEDEALLRELAKMRLKDSIFLEDFAITVRPSETSLAPDAFVMSIEVGSGGTLSGIGSFLARKPYRYGNSDSDHPGSA
jgi:hypothetical protein